MSSLVSILISAFNAGFDLRDHRLERLAVEVRVLGAQPRMVRQHAPDRDALQRGRNCTCARKLRDVQQQRVIKSYRI